MKGKQPVRWGLKIRKEPLRIVSTSVWIHPGIKKTVLYYLTPLHLGVYEIGNLAFNGLVDELIENIGEESRVDIVQALAAPMPGMVITELFGVPVKDRSQFKKWVDILFQPYDKETQADMERKKQVAAKEYYQYLYPIVVEKRSNPSEDIISDLIQVEVDGDRFTDDAIVRISMFI